MDSPKCILILTADAGFGHRSAANAVAAAMAEKYGDSVQIEIVNPLDDERTPFFIRDSQSDYDIILHHAPELYKFGYDVSDGVISSVIVESALTVLLFEVMRDIIRKYQQAVILTTYPLYHAPLQAYSTLTDNCVPILTTVTDLVTVHKLWFNSHVTACCVPTEEVYNLALSNNISPEKVFITGIPVHPQIVQEKRTKEEIRQELGWQTGLPTFLAVGSRRVDRLLETLNVLNHFGAPVQLAAVAGKDEKLFAQLKEIEWHIPVHLYEFVDNMPDLMHASDVLISKAGGLIVTEAMAAGLPMILVDILPGQEEGNAEYVVNNNAGDLALDPTIMLEITAHWLQNNCNLLTERAAAARSAGKPDAAYQVAEKLWLAANGEPLVAEETLASNRTSLIDLLNQHKVKWQENLFLPGKKQS